MVKRPRPRVTSAFALIATTVAVASPFLAAPAQAATTGVKYNVTIVKTDNATFAGINNSGTIIGAGTEEFAFADPQGFVLPAGSDTPQFLQTPGDPHNLHSQAVPLAINNKGVVVGYTVEEKNNLRTPVEWLTPSNPVNLLTVPGLQGSVVTNGRANAINDDGVIVGEGFEKNLDISHPFAIQNGTGTLLPGIVPATSFPTSSAALGVNTPTTPGAPPVIVGLARANNQQKAVEWVNGQIKVLGALPGGGTAEANAVNAAGVAVGGSDTRVDSFDHAVTFAGGTVTDLNAPGFDQRSAPAVGINASGTIIGQGSGGFAGGAFVTVNGQAELIDDLIDPSLNIDIDSADGINDSGVIVGQEQSTADQSQAAVILTPVK